MSKTCYCLRPLIVLAVALSAASASAQQRLRYATPIAADGGAASGAQFSGTIDASRFDPYADPAQAQYPVAVQPGIAPAPGALPTDFGQIPATSWPTVGGTVNNGLRFLQTAGFEYTWIVSNDDLGINEIKAWTTFAIPSFFYNNAPLLISPGFNLYLWDGPSASGADLPGQTYSSYIDVGWRPQVTPWLRADLGVRVGVFTDFETLNNDSVRFLGRGFGVFDLGPNLEARLGVLYLDRLDTKLLPAGGLVWTPNPDARYEILFPNPRLAHRWFTTDRANWWGYVAAEYGGDTWTIRRSIAGTPDDQFDYRDIRVMIGLERVSTVGSGTAAHGCGPRAYVEVGYVFDREIQYRSFAPLRTKYEDTFMVRGGFRF